MHKSHLSADGAKSAVGMATAGRCKTLPGDAGDAGVSRVQVQEQLGISKASYYRCLKVA